VGAGFAPAIAVPPTSAGASRSDSVTAARTASLAGSRLVMGR
jgi:hypothetical protein